jgi:hypothetical protein
MQARLITLLVVAAALSACNSTQRYKGNQTAAQAWLDSNAGAPAADLTGRWVDATDDGWGEANLVQRDGKITGTLGSYQVDGVMSGARVNLALKSEDWYYYSVVAVLRGSALEGYYSSGFPERLVRGESLPFRFERAR